MRRYGLLYVLALSLVGGAAAEPLRFVAWDYEMNGEKEFYEELIADFERAHPGAKVEFQLGQWAEAHQRVAGWVAQGGVDLVILPDIWLTEFAPGLQPYGHRLPADLCAAMYPVLYRKGILQGRLYGLVWATSTKALFYRTDLFAEAGLDPPDTWEDLRQAARKLHHPPDHYGLGLPGAKEYDTTDNFYFFFWSNGGEFFDEQGRAAINSPAGVEALQFYVDLIRRDRVTQPNVTDWNRNATQRLFEQGRLAMFETGPWALEALRQNVPDLPYGVVPLPQKTRRITQVITDHLGLLGNSPQKELALKFILFAYQRPYRLAFAKLGMVPERMDVASDDYFQKNPVWKVFVDLIPQGKTLPALRWEPVEQAMQQALYDAITGRRTAREALNEVAAVMNAVARGFGR